MDLHLVTGRSGKEHITSADHGAFNAAVLLSGQFVLNRGKKFAASVVSNNLVEVLDGEIIMQGRYIRVNSGAKLEAVIDNGTQDMKRNDLIVVRYSKDAVTEIENTDLVVIKGESSETEAVDPEYIEGNILDGDLTADFPLYRVPLDGLNVGELVPLFETIDNLDERILAILSGTTPAGDSNKLGGKGADEYITTDGNGQINGNTTPLILNNKSANSDAWLGFRSADEKLGFLGFNKSGTPQMSNNGIDFKTLATTADLTNYLPLSGGKANGGLEIDGISTRTPLRVDAWSDNEASTTCMVQYKARETVLGQIGFDAVDSPAVITSGGTVKSILTTLNKPSGSYTGNGSAESRTIATGAMGNACIVWAQGTSGGACTTLISRGGFGVRSGSPIQFTNGETRFETGNLYLATADMSLNEAGVTYYYISI